MQKNYQKIVKLNIYQICILNRKNHYQNADELIILSLVLQAKLDIFIKNLIWFLF